VCGDPSNRLRQHANHTRIEGFRFSQSSITTALDSFIFKKRAVEVVRYQVLHFFAHEESTGFPIVHVSVCLATNILSFRKEKLANQQTYLLAIVNVHDLVQPLSYGNDGTCL
jgi:hypothetical protein